MNIRVMEIKDYEAVYSLWANTSGMGIRSLDDSHEGIVRFLQRNPYTSFIAEEDKKIIGAILCGHDGRRGFIYHTAVNPDFRKQGIAKSLVNASLYALEKEKINKVALVVFESNDLGKFFWESFGFSKRDDLIYRNISINHENK